jgi:hypothetical protein
MGWAKYHTDDWVKELTEKQTHLGIRLLDPPYIDRYPLLRTLTTGDPYAPEGNVITRNIHWGGQWDGIEGKARPMLKMEGNLLDADPLFVDAGRLNFQLRDNSPAFRVGFERIPIEQIGLYRSPDRASWPVRSPVAQVPPPEPPKPARTGPPPVAKVARAAVPIVVDGALAQAEWSGLEPAKGLAIAQGIQCEPVQPASRAWLAHDSTALYVAFSNTVVDAQRLRMGNTWGQDDAVEIALRNAAVKDAPILVLRGYPSGHWESSDEAGAPAATVKQAAQGVLYAAQTPDATTWVAEWKLPWAALGLDPEKPGRFEFNLSVRKTLPEPQWLMWVGTGAHTWDVQFAGILELVR